MDSTLLKGLGILERVVAADGPCGISALARETGLPKSNIHRTLTSLLEAGYLLYDPAERLYYPSLKLAEMGRRVSATFPFKAAVEPHLELLAEQTGESAHFAVMEGENVFFMSSVLPKVPLASYLPEGLRMPWAESAFGIAAMAFMSEQEARPEADAGDKGLITLDALAQARRLGYALQRDHRERHSFEIAVALRTGWGATLGALGISGPATRFSESALADRVEIIRRIASGVVDDVADLPDGRRTRPTGGVS